MSSLDKQIKESIEQATRAITASGSWHGVGSNAQASAAALLAVNADLAALQLRVLQAILHQIEERK